MPRAGRVEDAVCQRERGNQEEPARDCEPLRARVMLARLSLSIFWTGAITEKMKAEAPEVSDVKTPLGGRVSRAVNGLGASCAKQVTAVRRAARKSAGRFMRSP